MAVRKNVYNLTDAEWAKLVQAIRGLKTSTRYDSVYVRGHFDVIHHLTPPPAGGSDQRNGAHRGPSFFPWHREFLRRYERDLQAQASDPNLGLPYWDWATDGALSDPKDALIFKDNRMGGAGTPVPDGDFGSDTTWRVTLFERNGVIENVNRPLNRSLGNIFAPTLPTQAHVDAALAIATYDAPNWNTLTLGVFRNLAEGWRTVAGQAPPNLHNRVHVFVGGDMEPMTSPNDPLFFFHHCFVDKMWADWQAMHPTSEYMPRSDADAELLGHRWDDPMFPWNDPTKPTADAPDIVRVRDVWDHRALGYTYDNTPASPPAEAGGCFSKLAKLFDP